MSFPGVLVPLVTPFTDEGALDLDSMPAVVEFMLSAGVTGVVAAGTTGEGYALDMVERRAVNTPPCVVPPRAIRSTHRAAGGAPLAAHRSKKT